MADLESPAPAPAPVLERARMSRRYMAAGLLISLFGTSVISGVIPGAVAAGALSIVWLPLIQTVEVIEDLMSPAMARLLRNKDPGKVLVACEILDAAMCLAALLAILLTDIDPYAVLIAYLLTASVVPLAVDVAEELFAGQLARVSHGDALRFNIAFYSAIGLVALLIARPLGSVVSDIALPIAIVANLITSLGAGILRLFAVRAVPTPSRDTRLGEDNASRHSDAEAGTQTSWWQAMAVGGPGSPLVSGTLACSAAIVVAYLAQWTAQPMGDPASAMAALLVALGLGMTLGPHLTRRAGENFSAALRLLIATRLTLLSGILAIVVLLDQFAALRFALMLILIFGLTAAIAASTVIQATARQVQYSGHRLAQAVGWSHSASAAGTLVGAWCGLSLGVQRSPVLGILVAVSITLVALRYAGRKHESPEA